jgi:predicted phage-related endonuclease
MFANIDRKIRGKREGLECKAIGAFSARKRLVDTETGEVTWVDKFVPGDMESSLQNKMEWYIQMQHYMAVTGWDMWHLAVLIGNQKFLWYDVPRDQVYIDHIIEKESEFWNLVENKINIWED